MALRVRRSGDKYVQTLKDGGDGALSRGEWETTVKDATPSVAALKATPAARIVAKARLTPVYVVEVQRRTADDATAAQRLPARRLDLQHGRSGRGEQERSVRAVIDLAEIDDDDAVQRECHAAAPSCRFASPRGRISAEIRPIVHGPHILVLAMARVAIDRPGDQAI